MEFLAFIIKQHAKTYVKTEMERVHCFRTPKRAGAGGSPVQVYSVEDHSGVSVPKDAETLLWNRQSGRVRRYFHRYREHV